MNHMRKPLGVWLVLCAALAGCQDPVYANQAIFEIDGDERTPQGGLCIPVGDWRAPTISASGGRADRDLTYDHFNEDDTLVVDIRSQERLLEHREYSEKQLRAGKRDTFTVTTLAGRTIEVNYWGSDDCELTQEAP